MLTMDITLNIYPSYHGGHPFPQFGASVSASCHQVDVDVHGGGLCSVFKGEIEKDLRNTMQGHFETMVAPVIEKSIASQGLAFAEQLAQLPVQLVLQTNLIGKIIFDLSTTGCASTLLPNPSPALTSTLKGSFFTPQVQMEPPFLPTTFPTSTPATSQDIQLCMSRYVFDSFGWMLYQNEVLAAMITNSDLPPDSLFQLNTSNIFMAQLAPSLATSYPKRALEVYISCTAKTYNTSAPSIAIVSGGLVLHAYVGIHFYFLDPQPKDAFTLGLKIKANLLTSIHQDGSKGSIAMILNATSISLSWSLTNSSVGTVNLNVLTTLDAFLIPVVLRELNSFFIDNTFAIPSTFEKFQLVDVSGITFVPKANGDNFICITSNVVYVQ